jgi:hypothetical protein
MIKVVDRLGQSHKSGEKIYAYYDTYKGEYIVLQTKNTTESTPTIYGLWDGSSIYVEGYSGLSSEDDISIGDYVAVENLLNLPTPNDQCNNIQAVAIKFAMN